MIKTLKWILIIIFILMLGLFLYIIYKYSIFSESFILTDEQICLQNLCKNHGADYGILNKSSNLCTCYRGNDIFYYEMES